MKNYDTVFSMAKDVQYEKVEDSEHRDLLAKIFKFEEQEDCNPDFDSLEQEFYSFKVKTDNVETVIILFGNKTEKSFFNMIAQKF